jgi:DNA-binding NarL/FixJ family response regulator
MTRWGNSRRATGCYEPEEFTAAALTRRERDVASLIAAGRSNREIARELVISEGTVEVHVKHILNKPAFRSRSQVAVWVSQHGLDLPTA